MAMAISKTVGLKLLFLIMAARLYQPDRKLIRIGNANIKPSGSPISNWRNDLFSFSLLADQYCRNNLSSSLNIIAKNRKYIEPSTKFGQFAPVKCRGVVSKNTMG